MVRKLVARLLRPLLCWLVRPEEVMVGLDRSDALGIHIYTVMPWRVLACTLEPAEARRWAAELYRLARDQQESIPAREAQDDASDLRW